MAETSQEIFEKAHALAILARAQKEKNTVPADAELPESPPQPSGRSVNG